MKGIITGILMLGLAGIGVSGQAQSITGMKLHSIKGGKKKLNQFKGKVVYVDVWAGWCAPCISSMPSLVSLKQEFGDDLEIVTINVDEKKREWKRKYKKHRPIGTALWAKGGQDSKFSKRMNVYALPRYILIDKKGRVVDANAQGPYRVKKRIRELVGRRAASQ